MSEETLASLYTGFYAEIISEFIKDMSMARVLQSSVHALGPMFLASSLVDIGMSNRNLLFNPGYSVGEIGWGCANVAFGRNLYFLSCYSF